MSKNTKSIEIPVSDKMNARAERQNYSTLAGCVHNRLDDVLTPQPVRGHSEKAE